MTTPPTAVWSPDTRHLGQRVHVHDALDSTNTLALSFADDPTQHGLAILTRAQTAGRGQYGRSWHAPPGSSVLMSLLLFPPEPLRRPALLTAWAAVSVCDTVLKVADLQPTIKWPNDVLIHGKKVCGILIEQRTTRHADFPLATVVGIGLNVTQSAALFEQAGLPDAASLAMLADMDFASDDVAKALLRGLDAHYASLLAGDVQALETQWKRRLDMLGKTVSVESVRQTVRGRLLDVTFAGIDVEIEAGIIVRLAPGSVTKLRR